MSKNNYILIIFEGEKTEKEIFDNLQKYFLNNKQNRIIYGFYCSEVYSLYNKLKKTDESIFYILRDALAHKNPILNNIKESQVESVYLFFDYDGHAPSATYTKLNDMLNTFNNEFENGKLYVSYPMVESLRHIKDDIDFKDIVAISAPGYKKISKQCNKEYLNFNNYTKDIWNKLIIQQCKKVNYIVNDDFNIPNDYIEQLDILTSQKTKYINQDNKVAVLSAFPIFLADYYGYDYIKKINN